MEHKFKYTFSRCEICKFLIKKDDFSLPVCSLKNKTTGLFRCCDKFVKIENI